MANIFNEKAQNPNTRGISVAVILDSGETVFTASQFGLKTGSYYFSAVGSAFVSFVAILHDGAFVSSMSLFEFTLSASVSAGNLVIANSGAAIDISFSITEL